MTAGLLTRLSHTHVPSVREAGTVFAGVRPSPTSESGSRC